MAVSRLKFGSEEDFLAFIDGFFPREHRRLVLGRGDDCAIIRARGEICISADLFLEDVHFRTAYFSPADIGYKALAVNLSDLAGMGAQPLGFVLELMIGPGPDREFFTGLFTGMAELAAEYDIPLAGGDLSRAGSLGLAVTVWGEAGPNARLLPRGGAKPGDMLFIVGDIGLARVGLDVLESGKDVDKYPACTAAHLRPGVLLAQGQALAEIPAVRGLMDVSDGLAKDLPRFLGPGLGADMTLDEKDIHPEVLTRAGQTGADPLRIALAGGEDYALLGACAPESVDEIKQKAAGMRIIGRVTGEPGMRLNAEPLDISGFDHFSPTSD